MITIFILKTILVFPTLIAVWLFLEDLVLGSQAGRDHVGCAFHRLATRRGRNAPAESDRQRLTRTAAPGTVLALLTATHLPNFVLGRVQ